MEKTERKNETNRLYVWLVLGGIFLLVVCTVVWACTAQIRSTVETVGISHGNAVICYLSKTQKERLSEGMSVKINEGMSGSVSMIADMPVSKAEVMSSLSGSYIDYMAAQLNLDEWNYRVVISLDESVADGKLMKIAVITDSFRPIDFLR